MIEYHGWLDKRATAAMFASDELVKLGVTVAVIAFDASKHSKGVDSVIFSENALPEDSSEYHYEDFDDTPVKLSNVLQTRPWPSRFGWLSEPASEELSGVSPESEALSFIDFVEDVLQSFCPPAWRDGETCDGVVLLDTVARVVHITTNTHIVNTSNVALTLIRSKETT